MSWCRHADVLPAHRGPSLRRDWPRSRARPDARGAFRRQLPAHRAGMPWRFAASPEPFAPLSSWRQTLTMRRDGPMSRRSARRIRWMSFVPSLACCLPGLDSGNLHEIGPMADVKLYEVGHMLRGRDGRPLHTQRQKSLLNVLAFHDLCHFGLKTVA